MLKLIIWHKIVFLWFNKALRNPDGLIFKSGKSMGCLSFKQLEIYCIVRLTSTLHSMHSALDFVGEAAATKRENRDYLLWTTCRTNKIEECI